MLQDAYTFNGFTTNDIAASRKFYADTLGLQVTENKMRILQIKAAGGNQFIIYPKEDHEPAKFTVLNFEVKDIKERSEERRVRKECRYRWSAYH